MRKNLFILLLVFVLLFISACGKKADQKEPRIFDPDDYEYHSGVAWVQLEETHWFSTEYTELICIDENGVEIFSTTDVNINRVSNFYNDIALVDRQYIINKSGEIIHNLKEELDVKDVKIEMFPDHYFDGFIFVNKEVEGVIMTGILNSNLEWVVELTSKFNDMEPMGNYMYYNHTVGFYDAFTNEFIDKDEYEFRHMMRCFPESGLIFLFNNGYNSFAYSLGTAKGEIYLECIDKTGFYNQNLELVLDLSDYPNVTPLSDFKNGKCLISFETAQKERYVGLINLKGKFIFIQQGYKEYDSEKIKFADCYFDWDGNCYKYSD